MKKGAKIMLRVLWIVAVIVILILICFVYHRYRLNAEKKLREPLGQLVDINGNNMSIYVERWCFYQGVEPVPLFWILNPYIRC
jgi:hypothetical protein